METPFDDKKCDRIDDIYLSPLLQEAEILLQILISIGGSAAVAGGVFVLKKIKGRGKQKAQDELIRILREEHKQGHEWIDIEVVPYLKDPTLKMSVSAIRDVIPDLIRTGRIVLSDGKLQIRDWAWVKQQFEEMSNEMRDGMMKELERVLRESKEATQQQIDVTGKTMEEEQKESPLRRLFLRMLGRP